MNWAQIVLASIGIVLIMFSGKLVKISKLRIGLIDKTFSSRISRILIIIIGIFAVVVAFITRKQH